MTAKNGLPIGFPPLGPPVTAVRFMSDAAGAALSWSDGVCRNLSTPGDRGVASVGFVGGEIFFAGGLKWPHELLTKLRDSKGRWCLVGKQEQRFGVRRAADPVSDAAGLDKEQVRYFVCR